MQYIKDLQEGQRVVEYYLCKDRAMFRTKAGKNYLSLTLQDKTGTISAKVWEINMQIGEFAKGDFIKVDAQVTSFQSELQLNITRLRRADAGEYNPADYSPCTEKNMDEMYQQILSYISQVNDRYLRQLLDIFYKNDSELVAKIRIHPAAKSVHHNFVGGYLEHVTSVAGIAEYLAGKYSPVNRDLVITAALLHDIGKLWELTPMPAGDYSMEGQLLGHIMIVYNKIHEAAGKILGFPAQLLLELEHIILAHHGELEYGSPKVPMTMEASIIHMADNTDAKLKMVEEFLKNDQTEGEWTDYNRFMGRNFYKGTKEE